MGKMKFNKALLSNKFSDAVMPMLKLVVAEKALPFEPLIPNAETIEAIKAARRVELSKAASLNGLFEGLNADD